MTFLPIIRRLRRIARRCGFDLLRYPHDKTLQAYLGTLLDQLDIRVVLDVGAHWGEFGSLLREVGYRKEIHSFEPVRQNFERLADRCKKDASWHCHPWAVGAQDGQLTIRIAKDTVNSSALSPTPLAQRLYGDYFSAVDVQEVESKTVESIIKHLGLHPEMHGVFLKVDTQGLDWEVFKGAGPLLVDFRAIQAEFSVSAMYEGAPGYHQVLQWLEGQGFGLSAVFPVNRTDTGVLIEFDGVLIQESWSKGRSN